MEKAKMFRRNGTLQAKQDPACGLHCIQMKNISVRDGAQTIIENINLHIHCGKITVVIGKTVRENQP